MRKALVLTALVIACSACSHAKINGTQIDDTREAREILDVFGKYRMAIEARDPNALLALAAPSYYDPGDANKVPPEDYAGLRQRLPHAFDNVAGIKLDVTPRDLDVKGDSATLDYFQVMRYAVRTPNGEKWVPESDDARMKFVRVDGQWKIQSRL